MSGYVAGLCWKAKFGCSTAKAVAVALADHANDDGGDVFPSVRRLSEKVEISERSVQRALRKLEGMGVIRVVSTGGAGPKDTREWCFDLHLIRDVVDRKTQFTMPEDKGDTVTPLDDELRVTSTTAKGDTHDDKGDTHVTRNVIKLQETPSAPLPPAQVDAQPSGQSDDLEWKGAVRPAIRIYPGESAWGRWLEHIEAKLGTRAADAVIMRGELEVSTRWPTDETPLPSVGRTPA